MSILEFITGKSTSPDVERTDRDDDVAGDGATDDSGSSGRSRGRTMVLMAVVVGGLLAWRRRRS